MRVTFETCDQIFRNVKHDPRTGWRRILPTLRIVKPHTVAPTTGHRLWIYYGHSAVFVSVFYDRRLIASDQFCPACQGQGFIPRPISRKKTTDIRCIVCNGKGKVGADRAKASAGLSGMAIKLR